MTTNRPTRPTFKLLLQPVPRADQSDQDGTRRLRAALKALLRSYGLRCIRVEPATDEEPEPSGPPDDEYAFPLPKPKPP